MSALVTVSISMHVRCAECESSIQLGAIVDRTRCHRCGHIEQLPPQRWRNFLDSAVNDGPDLPTPETNLRFDDDSAWINVHAETPKCAACTKPLPPGAAENGRKNGKCFCVGCGAKIGFRPVPPAFTEALPRVTHLLGEDGTQIKTPEAPLLDPSQLVTVRCPDCGGNIQPDGRSRAVRCPYCSILVVLSQAVWGRMNQGTNDPHVFYLVVDRALPKPSGRPDVQWTSLDHLAGDAQGNVFGIGTHDSTDDERMVFALDRQGKTKWVRKNVGIDDDGRLAWRNDDVVVAWSPRRYSAILLRAADGHEIGKVGGEQPAGLDRHVLDLSHAQSLAVDTDGTFLFAKNRRLARCAPDGSGQLTWPPGQGLFSAFTAERLEPFTDNSDSDATSLDDAGDRPVKLRYANDIKIGWDGLTYLRDGRYIACHDRNGKKLWGEECPEEQGTVNNLGVDARGTVYLLCARGDDTSSIFCISPGGGTPRRLVDGYHPHTQLRSERDLVIHPDGTIFVGDSYRRIRIFAPDGRPLYRSEEAIKDDTKNDEKVAAKRGGDKVR